MERTWDEIEGLLRVRVATRNDEEWLDEKMRALEVTVEAIISRLSRAFPDPKPDDE